MRKVYQASGSNRGLVISLVASVATTFSIFLILPFTHIVARPERTLELRKTSAVDLPPPIEETPPPPPEAEAKAEDTPPPPSMDDAPQQVPMMADLDVAVGGGGFLAGFQAGAGTQTAETTETVADAFSAADLEERPQPTAQTPPTYPSELRKAKVEGSVTITFVVDETGRVEDARVEKSSHPEFEKPGLEAIRKWRFRPGRKDGQPVRTYLVQTFRFRPPGG